MLISIVGKSASGKSSICRYLESLDDRIIHVDFDEIAHEVLTYPDVIKEIIKTYGEDVVKDGVINRNALGEIVFESEDMMNKLTDITWPPMEKKIDVTFLGKSDKILVFDWLLLPKTKYFELSDLKIWVNAPFEERVNRAIKRSNGTLTYEYFSKRDSAGIDYVDGIYDYVIDNSNSDNTRKKVKKIYEKCIISR